MLVDLVLDEHPAPAAPLTVAEVLTEKEFRHRYGDQHQSLYYSAEQTGFSRKVLMRLAAEYGIALRDGPQDYKHKGIVDR